VSRSATITVNTGVEEMLKRLDRAEAEQAEAARLAGVPTAGPGVGPGPLIDAVARSSPTEGPHEE
jgi:hypothetical protein